MFDPGYDILVKNQYPLGKTWITTSSELYKIVFGDTLFNEHVGTIRWNTKLLEDAFLRGSVLEELLEIKDAFITILKLMNRYRFSFEASMESFIKKLAPSSLKALEACGGNVNKLSAEDTFILLAETYEIMCCDMELLDRCGINEKDLRPQTIATTNDKKFNFYYFGWDLVFCTTPIKIDGVTQESKPYPVSFNSLGFQHLFNNYISGSTRRKSQHMTTALIELDEKIQQFTLSMETRRLPSLRIQNKLRAPSQPTYEPLALRTRRRGDDKKEPSEPTRDDILKQQKEGRAARYAKRQEALDLVGEKTFLNDVAALPKEEQEANVERPSEPKHGTERAAVYLDRLDILINSVIEKAGTMVKAQKRKKRPKGSNQFYDDDTFMPSGNAKYIRVENLSGDVKAEIRKQMNQGRAARLEARNDPCSSKQLTPEVSLSAAITNVQQHRENSEQPSAQETKTEANVMDMNESSSYGSQEHASPSPPKLVAYRKLFTRIDPTHNTSAPTQIARPSISYRRPVISNAFSSTPTNPLYRPVLTIPSQQRSTLVHSPHDPSATRLMRVIRQPIPRHVTPIIQPVQSQMYLNHGSSVARPSFQPTYVRRISSYNSPTYVRRIVSYDSPPRMAVPGNNSLKPGIYHQATPNTFVQTNNNLSTNVFPLNSNINGIETKLTTNGKVTENGVMAVTQAPLKQYDQDQSDVEHMNGFKPEDKVLSTNQWSNQHF